MVKVPALAEDGQNWKIYHAKLLEYAATHYCLDVLAGRVDDGTDDWDGSNALLWCTFMETVPLTIYIQVHHKTAHQIFNYLAKCFRNRDPIVEPRAKKLATCTNDAKRYSSAESPTSENAATGPGQEDLPCTKDLIRGTKDVDNRNVGRTEDPCMSLEALVKGNSTESAGTTVLLTGKLHETQNQPQNSLPLTPRLPIEGEPSECKQEAADSVVMAGCMNEAVQSANSPEMDADVNRTALLGRELAKRASGVDEGGRKVADVDRTALLGGEPAERASGVNKGDEECEHQSRLQQMNCEKCQRNGNMNGAIPSTHRLPLEGEWTVRASGKARDLRSSANAPNATPECVHRPNESRGTEDAEGVESEGCKGGTSGRASVDELNTTVECCQQLCMVDSGPGCGFEPADILNESDTLVIMSIESESPNGGGIPHVRLGNTSWRACDANGPRNGVDRSSSQADGRRGRTDTLDVSNGTETDGMSWDDGAGMYLGVRGAKRVINASVGVGSHTDTSDGHRDVPSVQMHVNIPANTTQNIRTT